MRTEYFGQSIPGLWRTSRALAKRKQVTLTAFGFVEGNKVIKGTEKTAALLFSCLPAPGLSHDFNLTFLNDPSRVRHLFRRVVRQKQEALLGLYTTPGQITTLSDLEGITPFVPGTFGQDTYGGSILRKIWNPLLLTPPLLLSFCLLHDFGLLRLSDLTGLAGLTGLPPIWEEISLLFLNSVFLSTAFAVLEWHSYSFTAQSNVQISLARCLSHLSDLINAWAAWPKTDSAEKRSPDWQAEKASGLSSRLDQLVARQRELMGKKENLVILKKRVIEQGAQVFEPEDQTGVPVRWFLRPFLNVEEAVYYFPYYSGGQPKFLLDLISAVPGESVLRDLIEIIGQTQGMINDREIWLARRSRQTGQSDPLLSERERKMAILISNFKSSTRLFELCLFKYLRGARIK